jgi:tetratricopeptide (TPR) repeat protein
VGLLLVAYGAISLWIGEGNTPDATRRKFCELWLCAQPKDDSATLITPHLDEPLDQARAQLALDPASAYRWADLADSEINANHLDPARFCVRQALASAPGSPVILFRAADLYLRLEDYPDALRYLMAVLRNPDLASFYDRVFSLYSEMDSPLRDLLNQGIPRTPATANAFLRFWINQDKVEEADETWNWINRNSLTSLQSTGSYVTLLANDGRWDEAMNTWRDYTARLDPNYQKTNWVFNGSFEMAPADCPFDWRLAPRESVSTTRDTQAGYKGSDSLLVRFSGGPKEGAEAYQTIFLKPGKWLLKAAMKTRELTTSQGVVIRVVDAEDPAKLDVATNSFTGTQEWSEVSRAFEVGEATRVARLEIIRPPALETDDIRLTGSVWLDAIQLAPMQ